LHCSRGTVAKVALRMRQEEAAVPRLQCKVSCICDHDSAALSMRAMRAFFAVSSGRPL